jgi:hypothetical protein
MPPLISFDPGTKTQTQSSEQQQKAASANGSLVLFQTGTTAERPKTRGEESNRITPALLPRALGERWPS